jgi:hypothetical protein
VIISKPTGPDLSGNMLDVPAGKPKLALAEKLGMVLPFFIRVLSHFRCQHTDDILPETGKLVIHSLFLSSALITTLPLPSFSIR